MDKIIIPPIKCQGIKTKLVSQIKKLVNKYDIWYEPFMGSGVVGFNIKPQTAIFSDTNPHLINFYNDIKYKKFTSSDCRLYLEKQSELLLRYGKEYYIEVRNNFNKQPNSYDFLFLNRSCFNGLMRFNSKGGFNVPFCQKNNRFSKSYITKIVNQIKNVENLIHNNDYIFNCCDFEITINNAKENDLIYCDPPYIDRYSDYYNGWTEEDELKLFKALQKTKANFILSTWNKNSYRQNHYIEKFWSNFHIINIEHFYFLGAKESNRNNIIESLVTNIYKTKAQIELKDKAV